MCKKSLSMKQIPSKLGTVEKEILKSLINKENQVNIARRYKVERSFVFSINNRFKKYILLERSKLNNTNGYMI